MASSLLRPPLKINPLTKKNSSSINNSAHNKSIIKKTQQKEQQQQHLKGKQNNSSNSTHHQRHQSNPEQLKHLLKQLKYCQQHLSFKKLLLLLFLATNDSRWWTAIENETNCNNLRAIVTATTNSFRLNYEQQQKQQLLQQPQLQFNQKLFESTKKFRKNLLNRKKFQLQLQQQQQLQLKAKGEVEAKKEKLFHRGNQLLKKSF